MLANANITMDARLNSALRCAAETGTQSRVSSKHLMHTFDGHAAFAHRGGAAFHRAGTHVTRGKDAGSAGLERPRRACGVFPCGCAGYRVAGFDEALFIAFDL